MTTSTYQQELEKAILLYKKKDFFTAKMLLTKILNVKEKRPDALHLLGLLFHQTGQYEKAAALISKAIAVAPTNATYFNSLGTIMRSRGKVNIATQCFDKALRLSPDYPEALYNRAGVFHRQGDLKQALSFYRHAVQKRPHFPEAWNNMSATLNMLERYEEAFDCCERALELKPNYCEALNNLGNAAKALGNLSKSIECYQKAIQLGGNNPELFCNLANAYADEGRLETAIDIYKRAIRMDPSYAKAYNNLGTVYRSKRDIEKASHQFKKSISLNPYNPEPYHNMGNLYFDIADFHSAALWYDKALSMDPESIRTIINRGIVYQETGDSENAVSSFRKVLELDPENSKAHSHLVHELYQRCEWSQIDSLNLRIDHYTKAELNAGRRPNEMPFLSLIRKDNPAHNYQVAKQWSAPIAENSVECAQLLGRMPQCSTADKLTIGYLSNNFRNHPTAHLISDIFQLHDRERFRINVYSYGQDDGSLYRKRIEKRCDCFVDIRDYGHWEAARRIYDDHVDILVDLVGYMRGHRLEICACRPAPIQVRWLGLAGTTGADFFDYIIADRIAIPEQEADFYSETLAYMPTCYQVNSQPLRRKDGKITRQMSGLPEDAFVFSCFCSSYKIEPLMFEAWMQILKRVPGSVLWLLKSNAKVEENLRKEASNSGVMHGRLLFANKVDKPDHLARIGCADVGLDTRLVNGAATTSDSLFSGVPVITLKGRHFASRMTASINNAIGMNALTTESLSDYINLAVDLGTHREKCESVKMQLRSNLQTKDLFNAQRFVRNLEKAYSRMWAWHCDGKRPEMIQINEE